MRRLWRFLFGPRRYRVRASRYVITPEDRKHSLSRLGGLSGWRPYVGALLSREGTRMDSLPTPPRAVAPGIVRGVLRKMK